MGFMDKAKQMFSSAKEQAGPVIEKTKDFASDAAEKAAPYVEKAKTAAVEGAEAIKDKVDEMRSKDDGTSSGDGSADATDRTEPDEATEAAAE
jgi:hypothetical protein